MRVTTTGKVRLTELVRAHVTFDAGNTWTTYAIDYPGYRFATDPSIAFDASGTAYLGVLAIPGSGGDPSIASDYLVVQSDDGGTTWSEPVVVSEGPGEFHGTSVLNDNSRLAAWGNGNVIAIWLGYAFGKNGRTIRGPVTDSVSHDGGATWSSPATISGSADFCVGFQGGHGCNQNVNDAVAVSPAGNVVVVFTNTTHFGAEGYQTRTSRLAVRVDPDTGTRIEGPFVIGRSFEGIGKHDYPVSESGFANGSPTIHDSQILIGGQGNVAADPTDSQHFAAVWYDDRNAPHPVAINPYEAVTNTDVIVSHSFDGGTPGASPLRSKTPAISSWPGVPTTCRVGSGSGTTTDRMTRTTTGSATRWPRRPSPGRSSSRPRRSRPSCPTRPAGANLSTVPERWTRTSLTPRSSSGTTRRSPRRRPASSRTGPTFGSEPASSTNAGAARMPSSRWSRSGR